MPAAQLIAIAVLAGVGPVVKANEQLYSGAFPVRDDCALSLAAYHGAVRIHPAPVGVIRVRTRVSTRPLGDREFQQVLGALHYDAESDGRRVTVVAAGPRVHFLWQEKEELDVTYDITVPMHCAVQVVDGNGSVEVGDLQAAVTVQTQQGIVYLRHIAGNVVASTSKSALILSACGGSAHLSNRRGDIRVGPVDGAIEADAASGDIDVLLAKGPATLSTNSGDISLGLPAVVGGPIDARTNSGDITLRVPPAAAATFHLSSVWGHIHVGLPLHGQPGGEDHAHLDGRLNGGGPAVTLRADGGHIEIKPSHS